MPAKPSIPLPADPGGVFASDVHRHVLGHLRAPADDGHGIAGDGDELVETPPAHAPGAPMAVDVSVDPTVDEPSLTQRLAKDDAFMAVVKRLSVPPQVLIGQILGELEEDGDCERTDQAEYTMTDAGFAKLTGPLAYEPPPMAAAQVKAMHDAGELTDDEVEAWRAATAPQEASA